MVHNPTVHKCMDHNFVLVCKSFIPTCNSLVQTALVHNSIFHNSSICLLFFIMLGYLKFKTIDDFQQKLAIIWIFLFMTCNCKQLKQLRCTAPVFLYIKIDGFSSKFLFVQLCTDKCLEEEMGGFISYLVWSLLDKGGSRAHTGAVVTLSNTWARSYSVIVLGPPLPPQQWHLVEETATFVPLPPLYNQ